MIVQTTSTRYIGCPYEVFVTIPIAQRLTAAADRRWAMGMVGRSDTSKIYALPAKKCPNRHQMSELFDRDVKTIGKHVNNVFKENELRRDSVVANFATTANDGKTYQVEYYNLDVIISVGYRVKSRRGTQFRQWTTQRLKEYLVQGYAINEHRLAQKQQEVQSYPARGSEPKRRDGNNQTISN